MAKMNSTRQLSFINMVKRNSDKVILGFRISFLLIFSHSRRYSRNLILTRNV